MTRTGPALPPGTPCSAVAGRAEGAFQTKPLASRAAIVAAGPIANFLLAIAGFRPHVRGQNVTAPRVDELVPEGAAAAGFKPGDVILSIDGGQIEAFDEMQRIVSASRRSRNSRLTSTATGPHPHLKVMPARREITDRFGNKLKVGVIGIKRNAPSRNGSTSAMGPSS